MTTFSTALPRRKVQVFRDIALPQTRALPAQNVLPYSTLSIVSIGCIALFVAFVFMYQTPVVEAMKFAPKALLSSVFIILAPAVALLTSFLALRRYVQSREQIRGMGLAYISFVISTIYFITALAMPLVLLGFYLLYVTT